MCIKAPLGNEYSSELPSGYGWLLVFKSTLRSYLPNLLGMRSYSLFDPTPSPLVLGYSNDYKCRKYQFGIQKKTTDYNRYDILAKLVQLAITTASSTG